MVMGECGKKAGFRVWDQGCRVAGLAAMVAVSRRSRRSSILGWLGRVGTWMATCRWQVEELELVEHQAKETCCVASHRVQLILLVKRVRVGVKSV